VAIETFVSTALVRHFHKSRPGTSRKLKLTVARGERVSFQAGASTELDPVHLAASAVSADDWPVRVRRVGWVPLPHQDTETPPDETDGFTHIPGWAPDPLFDECEVLAGPWETRAFWFTVCVPADAKPGLHEVTVKLKVDQRVKQLTVTLNVSELVLKPREGFPVTHWFYADALCDWYRVEPWSKAFWPLCERYLGNCAEHGLDTILTPLFTPPTDGVKRPTQLLRVAREGEQYRFDWRDVRKWVQVATRAGIRNFEWNHLFTQWGVRNAIRIYEGQGFDERLLLAPETAATSETYRGFLSQFLPKFRRFLETEGLLERSFFHVSDEPHGPEHLANYKAARQVLRELAPWMKTMDALSEITYGRDKVTDMPIPSIAVTRQYWQEGIPSWTYFCCGPRGRYMNRLINTPLPKIRAAGWLFYRFQRLGFLHWGYNYWYRSQTRDLIDPFTVTDGGAWPGWAYGDPFVVYPGPDGPIDSLRWEVWAESLQDFALLQSAGVDPDSALLAKLKDFDDFPKTERWVLDTRAKVLG